MQFGYLYFGCLLASRVLSFSFFFLFGSVCVFFVSFPLFLGPFFLFLSFYLILCVFTIFYVDAVPFSSSFVSVNLFFYIFLFRERERTSGLTWAVALALAS